MKHNSEHIPSVIFDWLAQYPFAALSALQQQEVLRHLSEAEYQELHQNAVEAKTFRHTDNPPGREVRKLRLLQQFDAKHSRNKTPVFWKVAAVLLLSVSARLSYRLMRETSPSHAMVASATDTIYISKEMVPVRTIHYDTVYVDRPVYQAKKTQSPGRVQVYVSAVNNTALQVSDDIPVLSIRELGSISNTPKRNSMKDDSLTKTYGYVAL